MNRTAKLAGSVVLGLALIPAIAWGLGEIVRDRDDLYKGRTTFAWAELATNGAPELRAEAVDVARTVIVPDLIHRIRTDTNESQIVLSIASALNSLPGMDVHATDSTGRRTQAIHELHLFGTNAAAAIPVLLEFVRSNDEDLWEGSAEVLPGLGADAETMVPLLTARLTNAAGAGNPTIVEALAGYGPKARPAFPGLLGLRGDRSSKEIIWAVPKALKAIDPEAAASAGVK